MLWLHSAGPGYRACAMHCMVCVCSLTFACTHCTKPYRDGQAELVQVGGVTGLHASNRLWPQWGEMKNELLLIWCDCSEVASGSGHGLATDIFSLGSVLYTMLVGGPPFESSDLLETINRIKAVLYKMPNLLSAKAQHLIMSVMRLSPSDRLTLHGLCWSPCVLCFCQLSHFHVIQLYAVIIIIHWVVASSVSHWTVSGPLATLCIDITWSW